MKKFIGKDFEIVDHTFTISRTPVTTVSQAFEHDLETGELLRDVHGQPILYSTQDHRLTTNYKFTFTVMCPDGEIRVYKQAELVNAFGQKRFKKAYRIYYNKKAAEVDE